MRLVGIVIILLAFCIPAVWFIGLVGRHDTLALFSQYLGVCALIAMGFSQIFATRIVGLEIIFGGMDRIYILHKWLGISAMALVLLHDTIDADMLDLGQETVMTEIAETLGEISLYGLLVLVTLSIATFIPYHLWKYTHKLMGAFFAFAALHFIFIQKPFANYDPLGLYVNAFCFIGVLSYIWTLMPVGVIKGWRRYNIRLLERTGDAMAITLTPYGRGHRHRAGQFAFVSFEKPSFHEVHPFTISKAPDEDRTLRFTIKNLGDYTNTADKMLEEGLNAKVSRPFGHFHLHRQTGIEVWIAAGVGITPFVALAQTLPNDTGGEVHLFYSARTRESAPHLQELEDLSIRKVHFHLHFIETLSAGRLTPEHIVSHLKGNLHEATVAFCGPKDMRRHFYRSLIASGLSARRFHFEEFEIRSGIGVWRLMTSVVPAFK